MELEVLNTIASQKEWAHNWSTCIGIIAVSYLALIGFGPGLVSQTRPWTSASFRTIWAFWNQALAVQSIVTFVISVQTFQMPGISWHTLICDPRGLLLVWATKMEIVKYIFVPFVLSKIVELGDTLFLVLAQKPIVFLHWFHHVTVLIFCWLNLMYPNSSGFLFVIMNSAVHSIMQTYQGLMIQGFRIPKAIAKCVTLIQISQMFVGSFATLQAIAKQFFNQACQVHNLVKYSGLAMQMVQAFLFIQFATKKQTKAE